MKRLSNNRGQIVIDANQGILGRVASYAAKQALLGKKVIIVNCSYALLSGNKRMIINEYNRARTRGGSSLKGPFFPKHPERIFKRTIRGMLNYQQSQGLGAFKRVICYPDIPAEFADSKKISFPRDLKTKTIGLKELSQEI